MARLREPGARESRLVHAEQVALIRAAKGAQDAQLDPRFLETKRFGNQLLHTLREHFLPGYSAPFPVHLTGGPSTSNSVYGYSWDAVRPNADNDGWEVVAGGKSYRSHGVARHFHLWDNLPATEENPIFAMLSLLKTADGKFAPFFDVPVQKDADFAHRGTASGSPTLGNREDRTKSEAEIIQNSGSYVPGLSDDAESIEEQRDGYQGWVETKLTGIGYHSASNQIKVQFWDEEYDVMGRRISSSITFHTSITTMDCS